MRNRDIGNPPVILEANEVIAKVLQNRGNSFEVYVPESHVTKLVTHIGIENQKILVGLGPSLRSKIFIRRNGFVVVTLEKLGPNGTLKGEITDIITDVRDWQKTLAEWPVEFGTCQKEHEALDLPPSLSDEESEYEEEFKS